MYNLLICWAVQKPFPLKNPKISLGIPGFVCVLKTLEFQDSDFKALQVLDTGFWSLKVFFFSLNGM